MSGSTCCGTPQSVVRIETVRGTLGLAECGQCGQRRWSSNGEAVSVSGLLRAAQLKPTRHLALVQPLANAA